MKFNLIGLAVVSATAMLTLQACTPRPSYFDTVAQSNPSDQCGAASTQYLLDKPAAAAESGLGTHRPVRMVGAGEVVTYDYVPNRLNILLNDAGIIVAVKCG